MRTNIDLSIRGTNVRLGDKVRDVISGFEGIATTHARHLTGCDRVAVHGVSTGGGSVEAALPSFWFDVQQLEVVEQNAIDASPLPEDVAPSG